MHVCMTVYAFVYICMYGLISLKIMLFSFFLQFTELKF